jgi:hypothetical protein
MFSFQSSLDHHRVVSFLVSGACVRINTKYAPVPSPMYRLLSRQPCMRVYTFIFTMCTSASNPDIFGFLPSSRHRSARLRHASFTALWCLQLVFIHILSPLLHEVSAQGSTLKAPPLRRRGLRNFRFPHHVPSLRPFPPTKISSLFPNMFSGVSFSSLAGVEYPGMVLTESPE